MASRPGLPVRLLLAAVILSAAATPADAAKRPNIVLVLADQWRAQALGYNGNRVVKTPHLDALARESIDFAQAVAGCPVCCPMRASLLTGQRPLTHGVFLNDVQLPAKTVTIAEVLAKEGWGTGYIGKWHVDGRGRSNFIPRERRQGFEYWKVLECTHAYNNSLYYGDTPEKLRWEGYDAIAQTRDAQRYIAQRAQSDAPFVLFLAWGPPHAPYLTAPPKYRAMYEPAKMPLRPNVPKPLRQRARRDLAGYYAHCTALDDCIAKLRKTIVDAGIERDTIFVFTSDHGDLIGSHGAYKKQQPYDESVRVPLLLRYPAAFGTTGRQVTAPINSEDLMPTLLGLCGVEIPTSVEGLDYSGYLRGGDDPSDGAALLTCPAPFGQWSRRVGGREYRALRTSRYTYARGLDGPWLLFDNQSDPHQLDNLAGKPEHAKLVDKMDRWLGRRLEASGDAFRPAKHYIDLWKYTVNANGTVPYTN